MRSGKGGGGVENNMVPGNVIGKNILRFDVLVGLNFFEFLKGWSARPFLFFLGLRLHCSELGGVTHFYPGVSDEQSLQESEFYLLFELNLAPSVVQNLLRDLSRADVFHALSVHGDPGVPKIQPRNYGFHIGINQVQGDEGYAGKTLQKIPVVLVLNDKLFPLPLPGNAVPPLDSRGNRPKPRGDFFLLAFRVGRFADADFFFVFWVQSFSIKKAEPPSVKRTTPL